MARDWQLSREAPKPHMDSSRVAQISDTMERGRKAISILEDNLTSIREQLTKKGISKERQDQIIRNMRTTLNDKVLNGEINTDQDVLTEIDGQLKNISGTPSESANTNTSTNNSTNADAPAQETSNPPSINVNVPGVRNTLEETPTPVATENQSSGNQPETASQQQAIGENPEMGEDELQSRAEEKTPRSVEEVAQQMDNTANNFGNTYAVMDNGVPYFPNDQNVLRVPNGFDNVSYIMNNGERQSTPAGEIDETNSVQFTPNRRRQQQQQVSQQSSNSAPANTAQPAEEPNRNYVVANNSVPYYENTPGAGINAYSGNRRDYSYGYEDGRRKVVNPPGEINESNSTTTIRPVDRGRFDYIRNNGWGSNSSILTRMGYSPEEIRRILDSSGAVRPEYFNY